MGKRQTQFEDKVVGANLRRLRLGNKCSQEELGKALGLTFQQVQKYEKGTNRISCSRAVQIARYFKVPVTVFFEGIDGAINGAAYVSPQDKFADIKFASQLMGRILEVPEEHQPSLVKTLYAVSGSLVET